MRRRNKRGGTSGERRMGPDRPEPSHQVERAQMPYGQVREK